MPEPTDQVFDDVLGELSEEALAAVGGKLFEVGYSDGLLMDRSRNRRIPYRVRYPKDFTCAAAVVILSHGGFGDELGHTWLRHFGTAYARLGFLAVNVGHLPSANEIQHRYNCPLDITFTIDALCRVAAAAEGTPFDSAEAFRLPVDFTGVPDELWLDRPGKEVPRQVRFKAVPDVDRIGVMGHSFGAFTAHAVGGAEHAPIMGVRNFRDRRVEAIAVTSPPMRGRYGYFDKGPDSNSWKDITIPAYVLVGERDFSHFRRLPFDRYSTAGDKFLTIGKDQTHGGIAGAGVPAEVRRLLDLNTSLFFHTYLRGGNGRASIGTLGWIEGWTLEKKLDRRLPRSRKTRLA